MGLLGFRTNRFTNDGDPHVQYYNRHFGIVLRPASPPRPAGAGAGLHHLCFRVETAADVDAISTRLRDAAIAHTPPRAYPQYAPDYYALHLRDPDGIHLEVTNYRDERRHRHDHWDDPSA